MPFNLPSAALLNAAFTSSFDVFLSTSTARSTTDTFGVGTRMAMPSRRPLSSGSTSPTAVAAPVVVGIIESAAARARRKSLCGRSRSCWSLVYEWTVVIQPFFDAERLVQHFGDRRQAVRRARRVGDDVVL